MAEKAVKEEEVLPFHVVEESATPDPVEEVKPVKVKAVYYARFGGGVNTTEVGAYDSEKEAEAAGATYLATHADTSFEVIKRLVQAD